MIEIFEGLPGGGKSYAAVATRIIPWLRKGRRVWVLFEGITLEKWAALTDLGEDRLSECLHLIERSEVFSLPSRISQNDAIVLDECQMVFRAGEKPPKEFVEFLERHRHYGVDIVLLCQRWDQLPAVITRLVEVTTLHRKMGYLGLSSRYQAKVRGCPNERVVMRSYVGRYDPRVYTLYKSYDSDRVVESSPRSSVWRSGTVIFAACFLLVVGIWWARRPSWTAVAAQEGFYSSGSAVQPAGPTVAARPAGRSADRDVEGSTVGASRVVAAVKITGTVCLFGPGPDDCLYVTPDGLFLTSEDIVALTGFPVAAKRDKWGRYRLMGEGVEYATVGSGVNGASHSGDGGFLPSGSGGRPDN
jgi:zona occludens toxin (predicted ATPase)